MASLTASRSVPRTRRHGPHFRAKQLHAEDVRLLPANVFLTHVHDARQTEMGARRGGGDAVLARAGFGDHAAFAHPHGQQRLPHRVVDLMGARVVEVLAFQINLRTAALFAQPPRVIQRRRPADKRPQQGRQLLLKTIVRLRLGVFFGQFFQGPRERFGHKTAAELAKTAGRVGHMRTNRHGFGLQIQSRGKTLIVRRRPNMVKRQPPSRRGISPVFRSYRHPLARVLSWTAA